ncbi:asparaginase [Oleiphilus messinensis]|uniref:L-asparaginase 1 n=1 Tax=Oleiphilus messinensis TaxID=141451 RepID=A0A1Y0I8M6_9GAMM|nr:asparaginase [Oleiphilus messinensis]ARU56126.1 asparaginase [Oleiphilus messinensis]
MRKHIYIAYTGGTIGMHASSDGYVPKSGFLGEILGEKSEFHRPEMLTYTFNEYPDLIDSADMAPTHWQVIAEDIQSRFSHYDGFIILHGTDTMAYTASALSFMFENLSKPVIITGSQIPLSELRSDGQTNLLNALYIAANYPIPEVTLFFNNKLFRGNRSRKVYADGFNAFDSPNFEPLLEAGIKIKVDPTLISEPPLENLKISTIQHQPIAIVSLYPGFSCDMLANLLEYPVKAIVMLTYGVGNAPQDPLLIDQLVEAKRKNIVVVNCTQCLRGSVNMIGYATGQALERAGVISGNDMTPEAALAKLHYLLSKNLTYTDVREKFGTNLRGELTHSEPS